LMVIAVDFDRTIHDMDNPVPGRKMGPPMQGARDALWKITRAGHDWDLFTVRGNVPYVWEWLRYYDFPEPRYVTDRKQGDWIWMIDDRAHHYSGKIGEWDYIAASICAGVWLP
jgi:hypothetical protein